MTMQTTPWGPADSHTAKAPGIDWFTTPSHGGFRLSPARIIEMPERLRSIVPFAGPGWYEEDRDATIVVLAFPQHFGADDRFIACRAALKAGPAFGNLNECAAWLKSDDPAAVRLLSEYNAGAFERADLWRVTCSGSTPRRHEAAKARLLGAMRARDPRAFLWWVLLTRARDAAQAEAFLTSEEERQPFIDLAKIPAERILARPEA